MSCYGIHCDVASLAEESITAEWVMICVHEHIIRDVDYCSEHKITIKSDLLSSHCTVLCSQCAESREPHLCPVGLTALAR